MNKTADIDIVDHELQPIANIHNIIMNNSKTQLIETMDYSNNKHN